MTHIAINYTPRIAFIPYHDNDKRYGVTVAHRRAGKTVARINRLIKEAALCTKPNPRFAYLAPYYVQAKDIAWLYLKSYASPIIQFNGKTNESELTLTFGHNNATIKLYGAENAERMRGLYFDGIVVDEAQGISKTVLTSVIMPALADRKGWLDVSGTPKGWANLLGELLKLAQKNPEQWFSQVLKASETGIIDSLELNNLKQLMPENEYEQEFECNFDAAITGAVYGKWLHELEQNGRVVSGLYDPELEVKTAWDLGYDDATAIWFWQQAGNEVRIIDFYENSNQDIAHYCEIVKNKPYKYGNDHFVPHDAANKLLAAGGRSIVQQAYDLGVKMRVVAATSQQNGIEAMRKVLGKTWFDKDACAEGFSLVKQYQYKWDDDKKVFSSTPRHDFTSHAADALEIIGQVVRNVLISEPQPKPKFFEQITVQDLFYGSNNTGLERL